MYGRSSDLLLSGRLPVVLNADSGRSIARACVTKLTAAGSVRDSHPIPFYFPHRTAPEKPIRYKGTKIFRPTKHYPQNFPLSSYSHPPCTARLRSFMMAGRFSKAQAVRALMCGRREWARAVRAYSTRGGTSG